VSNLLGSIFSFSLRNIARTFVILTTSVGGAALISSSVFAALETEAPNSIPVTFAPATPLAQEGTVNLDADVQAEVERILVLVDAGIAAETESLNETAEKAAQETLNDAKENAAATQKAAREDAEAHLRRFLEEKALLEEAEAQAQREAEAQAQREAEAQAQREAEAQAQREAEAQAQREAQALKDAQAAPAPLLAQVSQPAQDPDAAAAAAKAAQDAADAAAAAAKAAQDAADAAAAAAKAAQDAADAAAAAAAKAIRDAEKAVQDILDAAAKEQAALDREAAKDAKDVPGQDKKPKA
jgi:colicin import membrane protein